MTIWLMLWLIPKLTAQDEEVKAVKCTHFTSFFADSEMELSTENIEKLRQKVVNFIALQKEKQAQVRSELRFLRQLDRKIHTEFLKNYKHFSSFTQMLQSGNFDCLSGVILYALVLDSLGYNYTVYQTNIHVYLMIRTEKRAILIETTDPIYGFVDNEYYIQERKKIYEKMVENIENQRNYYVPEPLLHQTTTIQELCALQYYNQAAKYYNQHNLEKASYFLAQSERIYSSKRTDALRQLITYYTARISPKTSQE